MKKYSIMLIVAVAAFSAGRFSSPVEVKEVEKIVVKEATAEKKDTRSTRREVVRPDGTREIEVVRETSQDKRTEKEAFREALREVVKRPDWSVGLYRSEMNYLVTIDRRIIGGVSAGIYTRTDLKGKPEIGLGISFEF